MATVRVWGIGRRETFDDSIGPATSLGAPRKMFPRLPSREGAPVRNASTFECWREPRHLVPRHRGLVSIALNGVLYRLDSHTLSPTACGLRAISVRRLWEPYGHLQEKSMRIDWNNETAASADVLVGTSSRAWHRRVHASFGSDGR